MVIASIAYRDPDGAVWRADRGDVVTVHPDAVSRFDTLNRVQADPEQDVDAAPAEDSVDADSNTGE